MLQWLKMEAADTAWWQNTHPACVVPWLNPQHNRKRKELHTILYWLGNVHAELKCVGMVGAETRWRIVSRMYESSSEPRIYQSISWSRRHRFSSHSTLRQSLTMTDHTYWAQVHMLYIKIKSVLGTLPFWVFNMMPELLFHLPQHTIYHSEET